MKSVCIQSFSGPYFPTFGPIKLRIRTIFTPCVILTNIYIGTLHKNSWQLKAANFFRKKFHIDVWQSPKYTSDSTRDMAWWLYKEMLITPDLKELLTCGFRQILLDSELLEMLLSEFFQNIAYNEEDVGTVLKIWTLLLNVFFLLENAYAWKSEVSHLFRLWVWKNIVSVPPG